MSSRFAAAMKGGKTQTNGEAAPAGDAPEKPAGRAKGGRAGTRHVGGYFDPAVVRQLKQITVDEDTTLQDLLAESIDMLFESRRMPTIARKPAEER